MGALRLKPESMVPEIVSMVCSLVMTTTDASGTLVEGNKRRPIRLYDMRFADIELTIAILVDEDEGIH